LTVTAFSLVLMLLTAATAVLGGATGAGTAGSTVSSPAVSVLAAHDIPARYLRLYISAARRYGLDWAVLAGIGKVECDHGRDPDPSCSREGAVNAAGAGGPMQFLAATWASYGVDGDGDGRIDRWDPADAIYSAGRYLRAAGAPGDYARAIYAYNRAAWYVREVESWAARYRAGPAPQPAGEEATVAWLQERTRTPVRVVAGERATLARDDGHVALVPEGVPPTVQAMIVAGNELQGLPYGPQGHPDPRGATAEDCSSTVNYVLYRAGVRPVDEILHDNPLAQNYVNWGAPGPGRWVTIYAADSPTAHVFMTIAGLRLDTSHSGTDVGPNSGEDGPRWRVFDRIPAWARWSVRHPPGL
jgi:Transglycosylase SLT domain